MALAAFDHLLEHLPADPLRLILQHVDIVFHVSPRLIRFQEFDHLLVVVANDLDECRSLLGENARKLRVQLLRLVQDVERQFESLGHLGKVEDLLLVRVAAAAHCVLGFPDRGVATVVDHKQFDIQIVARHRDQFLDVQLDRSVARDG